MTYNDMQGITTQLAIAIHLQQVNTFTTSQYIVNT